MTFLCQILIFCESSRLQNQEMDIVVVIVVILVVISVIRRHLRWIWGGSGVDLGRFRMDLG